MNHKWIVWLSIVVLLAGLLPGAGPAQADGPDLPAALPVGDDFLISRAEGSLCGSPAIAYNDDLGEYLVVWVDSRGNAVYWDIYGQIVTAAGVPKGSNFVIRDEAAAILGYPDVAYDTVNQRYLVVWYDLTESDVEGQVLNSNGSAFGAVFNVAEGTPSDARRYPAVAFHPHLGEYLVVYEGGASSNWNVYGRRVSAAGFPGATEYAVCTQTGNQTDPDVSVDPSTTGDFLIVWEDGRTATDQIYGCLVYSTWFLGSEFPIASLSDPVYNPAVAFNPAAGAAGEWLVVYQRDVSGDDQIRGRRVTAAGAPTGDGFVICDDAGDQLYPDVAYNASGSNQWLAVWQDYRAGVTSDVYGRRVDVNGSTLGATFVIANPSNVQSLPAVASSSTANGYLVVWDDSRTEDICGQRVLTTGSPTGPLLTVSAPLSQQRQSAIAYNSTDTEFLVVWQDQRAGNWDIWGQRVDLDGALLGDSFAICANASGQLLPAVAYNLDTNQYLVVWEDRRTDADIYGQRVDADGTLDGGEIAIASSGSTPRRRPRVAFNPISGEYLVVYAYEVSESDHDVRARRVPASGAPSTAEMDIATGTADQHYPDVACRSLEPGGGGYLIVWRETVGTQRDIKGQRRNQEGGFLENLDICTDSTSQWTPAVAYSPDNDRYLVVWPDDRDGAANTNIYGRQVGGGGTLYAEFAVSTASGEQAPVAVTYGRGPGHYIVAWEDTRNAATPDLYGQRVSGVGALVDTTASANDLFYTGVGEQESPAVAWGGSNRQGLVVWQDGRAGASDYHIYGRRLEAGYVVFLPLVLRN